MGQSRQGPRGPGLLVRGRPGPPSLSGRRFLGETPLLQIPVLPLQLLPPAPGSAVCLILFGDSGNPNSRPPGGLLSSSRSRCGATSPRPLQCSGQPPGRRRPVDERPWGRKPRSLGRWAGRRFARRGCRLSLWFAATVGRVGGHWPARGAPHSASAKPTCQAGAEDRTAPSLTSA